MKRTFVQRTWLWRRTTVVRIRPRPVRPDSLSKKQPPEVLGEGAGGLAVLHAEMSQSLGDAVVRVWAFLSFLLALVYVANPKA